MSRNGRRYDLVFRRISAMLQIRHNAPRNRKNGGEFPLLKMNEGSSRSLSGCLARGRFSLHAPSIQVIQPPVARDKSEEHTSELQSLMRISYAVLCLKKNIRQTSTSYDHSSLTQIEITTPTPYYIFITR